MQTLSASSQSLAPGERLALLDGGAEAFPRMLAAIRAAERTIHLEMYTFSAEGMGEEFLHALVDASARGVKVAVSVDGWGSAAHIDDIVGHLEPAGVQVTVYNRLLGMFVGRFRRNHRKILSVDDSVAFLGGINLEDRYADSRTAPGWADLAIEIHGPAAVWLGRRLRNEPPPSVEGAVRIHLRGGRKLTARYVRAIKSARKRVLLAQAYFLPGSNIVRALVRTDRRGVDVRLLLTAKSDVPGVRAAMVRSYHRLLSAGVRIHEWSRSVLHAKAAVVDGELLLIGSFNLDPFSLANLEVLVEVRDRALAAEGEEWIRTRIEGGREITLRDLDEGSALTRWARGLAGEWVFRAADWISRLLASK